jgi:hypothetical protein
VGLFRKTCGAGARQTNPFSRNCLGGRGLIGACAGAYAEGVIAEAAARASWGAASSAAAAKPFGDLLNSLGFLNLGELFQLAVPIELADQGGILAPVRLNLNEQFKKDFCAED